MPEWLLDSFQKDVDISLAMLTVRLAMAFALGCVVAGVYRVTHGKGPEQAAGLQATLVLLTVLICMVTLVIGNNTLPNSTTPVTDRFSVQSKSRCAMIFQLGFAATR